MTARRFVRPLAVLMAALGGAATATAQPLSSPFRPSAVAADALGVFVAEAASRFAIPEAWIRAVMRVESGGQIHAISPKGAMGLMQIMPRTWVALRLRYGLGADPYDAHDNILAGSAYLRELWDRFGVPGFLAAYNAGAGRYQDHLATGRPLPPETVAYVARLAPATAGGAIEGPTAITAMARSWAEAPLFAARSNGVAAQTPTSSTPQILQSPPELADYRAAFAMRSEGLFVGRAVPRARP